MNVVSITLLSIFLPIIFLLMVFAFYVTLKVHFRRRYSTYLEDVESFLANEPYIETLTVLRTVDITLKEQEKTLMNQITMVSNNDISMSNIKIGEINDTKEAFASQYLEIEESIKEITKQKDILLEYLTDSRFFTCGKVVSKIEVIKKRLLEIKKIVNDETKKFIDPIKEFESKKYKYTKIVSIIKESSDKWLQDIQNDAFHSNIEDKLSKIELHLGEASDSVASNDEERAFSHFTKFKKILFDLINFGNHYDKFYEVLFVKANDSLEKVLDYLSKAKQNLSTNFENLNISVFLENVESELRDAKQCFFEMDIQKTEENIEKYFNSLLGLTFAISSEINAFNFFATRKKSDINKYYLIAHERFLETQERCNSIRSLDLMFYWNLENNLEEIKSLLSEIKKQINIYFVEEQEENKSFSYATRQNKYKNIFQLFRTFFVSCDEVQRTVDIFYTEGVSQGLKYNRLKKIYINSLADLKIYDIKLTIEDKEKISLIEKTKQDIESKLINQSNISENDLKHSVDKMFELMVDFILTTVKKIMIVKTFSIINTENSYKRLNSNIFDKKVIESEELIAEGQYEQGLERLILAVKEANN